MVTSSITMRSKRSGTVYGMAVGGMMALLGCAALTFDMGLAVLAKQQLQSAADSAALAGILALQSTLDETAATAAAVETAAANKVLGNSLDLDPEADVEIGAWDEVDHRIIPFDKTGGMTAVPDGMVAMRVTARRTTGSPDGPYMTYFACALGKPSINISASAAGGLAVSHLPRAPVELALCQDQSGSFEDEFPSARNGAVALTEFMKQSHMESDRMGYTGFGYQPNSSTTARKRDIWYFHDTGLKTTEDIAGGSQWIKTYIAGVATVKFSDPTHGNCYTNLYTGMLRAALSYCDPTAAAAAWTTFTNKLTISGTFQNIGYWNTTNNLTIGGVTKQRKVWLQGYIQTLLAGAFVGTSAQQVMVLCSDGMPWYHSNTFPDAKSKELCTWIADRLAAKGVRIHTVCLDQSTKPPDGSQGSDSQFISSLVRNGGYAFYTYDARRLENLLVAVGQMEVGAAHLIE